MGKTLKYTKELSFDSLTRGMKGEGMREQKWSFRFIFMQSNTSNRMEIIIIIAIPILFMSTYGVISVSPIIQR